MKKTTEKKLVCELLGISEKSYYRWVKERKIFDLLELYFSREDLQEFLETGKINKFEKYNFIDTEIIEKSRLNYINSFTSKNPYRKLRSSHNIFIDFYFKLLVNISNISEVYKYDFNYILNQYLIEYSIESYQNNINANDIDNEIGIYKEVYSDLGYGIEEVRKLINNDIDETSKLTQKGIFEGISKNICIFNDWDSYMLFFLNQAFQDEFKTLYYEFDDELTKQETIYHIVGFDIYRTYPDLSSRIKRDMLSRVSRTIIEKENLSKLTYKDISNNISELKNEFILWMEANDSTYNKL